MWWCRKWLKLWDKWKSFQSTVVYLPASIYTNTDSLMSFNRHIGHVGWDPNTGFDVSTTTRVCSVTPAHPHTHMHAYWSGSFLGHNADLCGRGMSECEWLCVHTGSALILLHTLASHTASGMLQFISLHYTYVVLHACVYTAAKKKKNQAKKTFLNMYAYNVYL